MTLTGCKTHPNNLPETVIPPIRIISPQADDRDVPYWDDLCDSRHPAADHRGREDRRSGLIVTSGLRGPGRLPRGSKYACQRIKDARDQTHSFRHDRASCLRSGQVSGSHVRGEDMVGVAVEVLAGPLWRMDVRGSACRAAIWTSRRSTPASSMVAGVPEHKDVSGRSGLPLSRRASRAAGWLDAGPSACRGCRAAPACAAAPPMWRSLAALPRAAGDGGDTGRRASRLAMALYVVVLYFLTS